MERVHISDGLLGDWTVNIEELKQVGEILASLSGSAYDGYLLWIVKEYLEIVFFYSLWGGFWFGAFRLVNMAINRLANKKDHDVERSLQQEAFLKIADMLSSESRFYWHCTPHARPESVVELVKQLLDESKGAAK